MSKESTVKPRIWDEKSLRCMGISAGVHLILFIAIYIAMMPAGGTDGEDMIEVSLESVSQENEPSNSSEEYQPDLSENIEDIENDLDNIVEDSGEEADFIREQYKETQNQEKQAAEDKKNLNKNLKRRSKYGPLTPRMFYGVRIFARNVIFVLDISGSMDIPQAILQLQNAYHSLKEGESFNIILYSDTAYKWNDNVQLANDDNKNRADKWLKMMRRGGGGTNMYEGLRLALETAREGKDTIYFLTDGIPNKGKIVDQNGLLQAVVNWNNNKSIVVNTIGIGSHQAQAFLESLAAQNSGIYHKR